MTPITKLVEGLGWVLEKLGVADRFKGTKVNTNLDQVAPGWKDPLSLGDKTFGESMREKFPGLFVIPDAINGNPNTVADRFNPSATYNTIKRESKSSKVFAPQISITTGSADVDAVTIANTVRQTVQEQWDQNMREALSQNGGFAE